MKKLILILVATCSCFFNSCASLPNGETFSSFGARVGSIVDSSKQLYQETVAPKAPIVDDKSSK